MILIAAVLICASLAGCAQKSDADRIIGKWECSIESGAYPLFQRYVFEKDGTGTYQFKSVRTPVPGKFQYQFTEDGTLVFSAEYMYDVAAEYAFSEDYNGLTLTIDGKSYELQKAKN